jgi:hypothetical protein
MHADKRGYVGVTLRISAVFIGRLTLVDIEKFFS